MTLIFIIITASISILAFNNRQVFAKLQFNPYQVYHRREYYRLLSHGFIHADWTHLIVNMITLYFFGSAVEWHFLEQEADGMMHFPKIWFTSMYLSAIVVSSLTTLHKYKDDILYNSVGASGGVSAVLFCSVFFDPWRELGVYFVIPVPGIIFAVLYLIYSQYMSKRNMDNINHDAHFIGAVFGFLFPILIKVDLIYLFIDHLLKR